MAGRGQGKIALSVLPSLPRPSLRCARTHLLGSNSSSASAPLSGSAKYRGQAAVRPTRGCAARTTAREGAATRGAQSSVEPITHSGVYKARAAMPPVCASMGALLCATA